MQQVLGSNLDQKPLYLEVCASVLSACWPLQPQPLASMPVTNFIQLCFIYLLYIFFNRFWLCENVGDQIRQQANMRGWQSRLYCSRCIKEVSIASEEGKFKCLIKNYHLLTFILFYLLLFFYRKYCKLNFNNPAECVTVWHDLIGHPTGKLTWVAYVHVHWCRVFCTNWIWSYSTLISIRSWKSTYS